MTVKWRATILQENFSLLTTLALIYAAVCNVSNAKFISARGPYYPDGDISVRVRQS